MPAIDQARVDAFIDTGLNAATTAEQGRALEDLICYVFGLVPGIAITHRNAMNAFDTEEIDVALFNEDILSLPNIILVEAKNWSNRVGSAEVAWFLTKLQNRGLDFGILVTTRGITGDATEQSRAHAQVAAALIQKRRLIVITTDELRGLADSDGLVKLIKTKLCDLAVTGTIA
ncbi:restriction endonuclease [Blastochloris sulfoviridis]|uniref:Restriction endonuclease n=1 Tax=Blastochloris sulfoviridis TaxID=50712 RepID=A0A5M6I0S7_9HYPH|nr:restriction endonuclease [Blastochloris sulfoviridis]KAA5601791.1 restriction endonuclease [Blastochloris sulfoviridis]